MKNSSGFEPVRVAAIGTAVPKTKLTQPESAAILLTHYGQALTSRNRSILQKVFGHPSIRQRYIASKRPESLFREDPDARMQRFTEQAVALSAAACRQALDRAGVSPVEIEALVVNTCTGYLCPGISTYLLEKLPLAAETRVYDLVGSGCGGAIPNLEMSAGLLREKEGVVLSVSVEICSATFQMDNDLSLIVSNALFADGAAACLLWKRTAGLAVIDSARYYAPEYREDIRYIYRKGQLHNQLAARLPVVLKPIVAGVVGKLLQRHGLQSAQIPHWAIHPGGEKVIQAIQDELRLSREQLQTTREVLASYGNMSSPTVWFALERIVNNGIQQGDWCMMVGMGAGLSVHACLLRA